LLKNGLTLCLTIIIISSAGLYFTGHAYIFRAINNTYLSGFVTANINDHTAFSVRKIQHGIIQLWEKHPHYNQQILPKKLSHYLQENKAAAFIVIKNSKIITEKYFDGYHDRSKTNSFSMAKTVLALLLGIAIEEGHIQSLDQKIIDFLPEFKTDPYGRLVNIRQLVSMTSGYVWDERYYSPLSPTVQLMYGYNVEKFLLRGKFSKTAGEYYYSSASSQILGTLLQRALTGKTISGYLSEKIWRPLGMNDNALWHLDGHENMELVFCCLNTNARNFAKLGQLMLNNGTWKSKNIIPRKYIAGMLAQQNKNYFGQSIWLNYQAEPSYFWFSGHLGQYIIVVPDENLVIVKLGEVRASKDFRKDDIPLLVANTIQMLEKDNTLHLRERLKTIPINKKN
jgi:CubicO group peptidase (beta-lactamase class C family)